jgi:hypothetical protein
MQVAVRKKDVKRQRKSPLKRGDLGVCKKSILFRFKHDGNDCNQGLYTSLYTASNGIRKRSP